MQSNTPLAQTFEDLAREAFATRPELNHDWLHAANSDGCHLRIRGAGQSGFDLDVQVQPAGIVLAGAGWHEHYQLEGDGEQFARNMLGLIRDLISPRMRIRELRVGSSGYRWHLECLEEDGWVIENTFGYLIWNFFGRKSERIHMNEVLPMRELLPPPSEVV